MFYNLGAWSAVEPFGLVRPGEGCSGLPLYTAVSFIVIVSSTTET